MAAKSKVEKKGKKTAKIQTEPTEEDSDGGSGSPESGWGSCLKFLLTPSNLAVHESVCAIVKLVKDSELDLSDQTDDYECFYSSFLALATHHICCRFSALNKTELNDYVAACRVIIAYILRRLSHPLESCCLSKKQLMMLLVALCRGAGPNGCLTKSDVVTLVSQLKSAKIPPFCSGVDVQSAELSKTDKPGADTPGGATSARPLRITDVYSQLTSVLDDLPISGRGGSVSGGGRGARHAAATAGIDTETEALRVDHDTLTKSESPSSGSGLLKEVIQMKNVTSLQECGGGDRLLNVCTDLVYLKRHRPMYMYVESLKSSTIASPGPVAPTMNYTEAQTVRASLHSVLGDVSVVWRVFSLPVLEPLTRERLEQIVGVTMSCLYAALSAAEASSVVACMAAGGVGGGSTSGGGGVSRGVSTSGREEEIDGHACNIVNKTLDIMNWVLSAAKHSSRGGGQVVQNLKMFFCWASLRGLAVLQQHCSSPAAAAAAATASRDQTAAGGREKSSSSSSSKDTAADTSGRTKHAATDTAKGATQKPHSAGKLHAGFGPFSVALASHTIHLISSLMDDIHTESLSSSSDKGVGASEAGESVANLNLFGEFCAIERIRLLLRSTSLPSLLFFLLSQSYKKAAILSRQRVAANKVTASALDDVLTDISSDARSSASSDSNTFYEEDFSNSDSNDDEDSEPLLGLWFEEVTSAKETSQQSTSKTNEQGGGATEQNSGEAGHGAGHGGRSSQQGRHHSGTSDQLVYSSTERREPDTYIRFAIDVLNLIGQYFLSSSNAELRNYISCSNLSDQHITHLSTLIRDMDADNYTADTCQLYGAFSTAVAHFLHRMIVSNSLSDSLQETLLDQLGVGLSETSTTWPLNVRPRTLTVLSDVLLLRQRAEKEEESAGGGGVSSGGRRRSDTIIIHIWSRFIDSLTNAFLQADSTLSNYTDVNVEHLQLLVFFFHGLALMQKKSLWLQLCQNIIKIVNQLNNKRDGKSLDEVSPLPLTRLLLVIDYLLHYFYDLPPVLVNQVQYNLFGVYAPGKADGSRTSPSKASEEKDGANKRYFLYRELEDMWLESGASKNSAEVRMKPKFYSVGPAECSVQDVPKVDGLACSFILSNPDQLNYDEFYEAVESLLFAGSRRAVDLTEDKASITEACYLHYHTSVCWRLLMSLPPSKQFLTDLTALPHHTSSSSRQAGSAVHAHTLNILHWMPRIAHKQFGSWIRDYLVKQSGAAQIVADLEAATNSWNFHINLAHMYLSDMTTDLVLSENSDYVGADSMPSLPSLYALDALLARTHYYINEHASASAASAEMETKLTKGFQSLLSVLLPLVHSLNVYTRSGMLHKARVSPAGESLSSGEATEAHIPLPSSVLNVYNATFKITSVTGKTNPLGQAILPLIPYTVYSGLDKSTAVSEYPTIMSWKNAYATDSIPIQSYMDAVQSVHLQKLSNYPSLAVVSTLKHVLHALIKFFFDFYLQCQKGSIEPSRLFNATLPLYFDVTCEHFSEYLGESFKQMMGPVDSEPFQAHVVDLSLKICYDIIYNRLQIAVDSSWNRSYVNELMLHECLMYMESSLDSPAGKSALQKYFLADNGLTKILLSTARPQFSPAYSTKVLNFFNHLLLLADKNPTDEQYKAMCVSLRSLAALDSSELQDWLTQMILPASMIPVTGSPAVSNPSSNTTPPNKAVAGVSNAANAVGNSGGSSSNGTLYCGVTSDDKTTENRLLLQSLTAFIVKGNSHVGEEVACAILNSLLPMGSVMLNASTVDSSSTGFVELMIVMTMLAGAGSGSGHVTLFKAAVGWLDHCKSFLAQKAVAEKLEAGETDGKHQLMLDSAVCLLAYIKDILNALKQTVERASGVGGGSNSPTCTDVDMHQLQDTDSDVGEDCMQDDDESLAGDDSDDDSLNNKLCTYTVTQKEFMNQHWYHCHTCKMVDGVGVCTVCARVCHKDHDLSYAKYGSFFCDCGAKEDRRCMALTKRTGAAAAPATGGVVSGTARVEISPAAGSSSGGIPGEERLRRYFSARSAALFDSMRDSYLDRSTTGSEKLNSRHSEAIFKQIQGCKDSLMSCLATSSVAEMLTDLLQFLMPSLRAVYEDLSTMGGGSAKAQQAITDLCETPKNIESTDSLLTTATLGSHEGTFESVRMSYGGDQGQTIRQLITSHVLRRVGMCCLTSPHGRRQHLAISNEKGKVMILQLSALFKPAHSGKRKLTLTRLSSASIPFTILSLAGSPSNEDFLAVCGLKDCHVLTFTSSGAVADHLVLHPSLETGNFIIKAVWLPGSQTELAIVTADFVKVYDLSVDAISPQYYFLLPTGKIRDVTFVYVYPDKPAVECEGRRRQGGGVEPTCHLLVMGSSGYIYAEVMDSASSASHGPFYMTNVIDVKHAEVKENNGQVCGGGVSIYYSHTLQLLFFSYSQGKSFIAPLQKEGTGLVTELSTLFQISLKSGNGGKSGGGGSGSGNGQALVQWMEVHNHPGLVCCLTQTSNNPVVLMIKPDSILMQEIKGLPAKAKIQDIVIIRHLSSNSDPRTTLILLCEDGSLRIYITNVEQTNYWLSPSLQPRSASVSYISTSNLFRPAKKVKSSTVGKSGGGGQVAFTVDFFEHCQPTNDIEFGGADILHVYNSQQVKNRLNTTGLYIANAKPGGFSMDISNTSGSTVMVGVRVLLGSQTIERAPSYIELFGRRIPITLTRHRWYDLPFAREEAVTSDKKFTITFGPSTDPAGVTMVDSVKVFTKTKEHFGWPDDNDDVPEASNVIGQSKTAATPTAGGGGGYSGGVDTESPCSGPSSAGLESALVSPLTSLDRLVGNAMEVLDGYLVASNVNEKSAVRTTSLQLSTQLLTLATPVAVQQQTKSLMSSLFTSRSAYHWHKDEAQLNGAVKCLTTFYETGEINAESFQRLVSVARSVAVSRPLNLVRFSEQWSSRLPVSAEKGKKNEKEEEKSGERCAEYMRLSASERKEFVVELSEAFWYLHATRMDNPLTTPVCVSGLNQIEPVVTALVEIMHAFTVDSGSTVAAAAAASSQLDQQRLQHVPLLCRLYTRMLLSEDKQVSYACKLVLTRLLKPRPVTKRAPASSMAGSSVTVKGNTTSSAALESGAAQSGSDTPSVPAPNLADIPQPSPAEPEDMLEPEAMNVGGGGGAGGAQGGGGAGGQNALQALLGGAANLQDLLDLPPDADDETMVQLAIALSLQDQAGGAAGGPINLGAQLQAIQLDAGHMSDTTASGPASEDEDDEDDDEDDDDDVDDDEDDDDDVDEAILAGGAMAVEDDEDEGVLHPSHADHADAGAASDSGGSNVDSVSVSGRSSTYGDGGNDAVADTVEEGGADDVGDQSDMLGGMSSHDEQKLVVSTASAALGRDGLLDSAQSTNLYQQRVELSLCVLNNLIGYLSEVKSVGGVRAIPYMQLILSLLTEVDSDTERDSPIIDHVLNCLVRELLLDRQAETVRDIARRLDRHEVLLMILRLLSTLMSRFKSVTSCTNASPSSTSTITAATKSVQSSTSQPQQQIPSNLSYKTSVLLTSGGGLDYCLAILQTLLEESERNAHAAVEGSVVTGQLLKPRVVGTQPDMAPFLSRQTSKGQSNDGFEEYPKLLMEITLRLAYQMKKIADYVAADIAAATAAGLTVDAAATARSAELNETWYKVMADYMMTSQDSDVKRHVRKLLMYSCGSKEKYRQLRDLHTLGKHMSNVRTMCERRGLDVTSQDTTPVNFSYDTLISLIEDLKACLEIAHVRTANWQKYCHKEEGLLVFLVMASIRLDEGISTLVLQLLQFALCGSKSSDLSAAANSAIAATAAAGKPAAIGSAAAAAAAAAASQASRQRKDKKAPDGKTGSKKPSSEEGMLDEGSAVSKKEEGPPQEESLSAVLVRHVCKTVSKELLVRFIVCFLLDSNITSVRWLAHTLVLHIYGNSTTAQREMLLDLMWSVWPELSTYGCKAAQFVDLLGYFTIKTQHVASETKVKQYVGKALTLLRMENKILLNHPNRTIYSALQGLVDFDGYYLERDPCLVCNNPEVPYATVKLSAIKVDSKFTTSTQIIKLAGSHNVARISLKITDLKRTKMVRTLNFYYSNRQVQAIVELKNKPGLWHKAKKVVLSSGQTEVKVDLPLPIIACNLMIEYADFYDNLQASAETLQCPRCSASVPANPGVCGNCGENVFQCHKCRAINYDEKDPFLCNACGYCKYAKFDFSLSAKPCCAVDPIETDDDRKKAVSTINLLLERADNLYKQLQLNKPALEATLVRVTDHSVADAVRDDAAAAPGVGGSAASAGGSAAVSAASSINRYIQVVAQKYCIECKATFEDLGKVIQKVLASRKELVKYDRQQQETAAAAAHMTRSSSSSVSTTPLTPGSAATANLLPSLRMTDSLTSSASVDGSTTCGTGTGATHKTRDKRTHCFGCATATVEHCLTLLRAMASNTTLRNFLSGQGLIKELVDHNLRHGSASLCAEVRQLTCLMSSNNSTVTEQLLHLLSTRINQAMTGYLNNNDFAGTVRHEILLMTNLVQIEDNLWESRVRYVLWLFTKSIHQDNPVIVESIALPCLRILQQIIKPPQPTSKKNKDKSLEALCSLQIGSDLHVNLDAWLACDSKASYCAWRRNIRIRKPLPTAAASAEAASSGSAVASKKDGDVKVDKKEVRARFLMEKYVDKWRSKLAKERSVFVPLQLMDNSWLRATIFSASSPSIRKAECNIVETMCILPGRKQEILDMLTRFLEDIGPSGEAASEFVSLYERLLSSDHWKYYLALKGVLVTLTNLLTKEIDELSRLEDTTLSSDLSQGFALKSLTKLLSVFLEVGSIKQVFKNKLVGSVLNGYLSLRKLVVQRSKVIDETQGKLLELLEEMTTGTESETREFMSVCVNTLERYPQDDLVSPVFIFERLCSIIYPEANDSAEFFMSLEKDPQQEDFLQGRMLSNPYSSNNPALGPLMRDIKNKICQDCELVALLEDDTGMELLVCNKIISLDLPVKDVHRKIWLAEHNEGEPMRVVYRMRGLLGDATEDMVNSLDTRKDEDVDNEEVYKMANVMHHCGGLKVMLARLAAVRNLVAGKQLMTVLLKLFSFCLKVKANRQELVKLDKNSISIMLGALNLALLAEQESGVSVKGQTLTEQILQIMETILLEASSQPPELYKEFSKLCGDKDQLMILLDRINSPFVRANTNILQALMRLIPFLAFGDQEKMFALVNHFKSYLDFNRFDTEHTQDELVHVDCFCVIAQGIESNANGRRLKDLICSQSIVTDTLQYLQSHAPHIKAGQMTDGDTWKEFISKASLPYALRLLTGLCRGHEPTQVLTGDSVIQILHNMEQISSDEHVGSLAENLLEALKQNAKVAEKIEEVRNQTKAEKKRLAMAMRAKQLGQLGMMANEKGQVTVKGSVLKQMEELKEETGLICCICREGYRYQPNKVLGIYTFTKRVNLEDAELKARKAQGYSTVSHFNVIHVDCHLSAVRHARGREEWDSAALQNGNTKCNGLLPLWGPQVPEPAFASCLARHNTYIQECTGVRDATYTYTLHDVKHLLLKFAMEKSFSEDSGGGGRESNIQLVPYLMHMTLYVINTTRAASREEKNLSNFAIQPPEKWIENSFEPESVLYWTVLALHVCNAENWKKYCFDLLTRIVVLAHVRHVLPSGGASVTDKKLKEYSVYRPYLLFFGFAHQTLTVLYKNCSSSSDGTWSTSLADYIRNNDQSLQEQAKKLLSSFEQELVPCESFSELLDVLELLEGMPDPEASFKTALEKLP